MTRNKILALLKVERPQSMFDLLVDCGFTLQCVGEGRFRTAFRIVGTPWIIKVPASTDRDIEIEDSIAHSVQEYDAYRRIMRYDRYKPLRSHMPEILYFDRKTGLIVMREYKRLGAVYSKRHSAVRRKIGRVMRRSAQDLHRSNFGMDSRGHVKLIDLGRLYGGV